MFFTLVTVYKRKTKQIF